MTFSFEAIKHVFVRMRRDLAPRAAVRQARSYESFRRDLEKFRASEESRFESKIEIAPILDENTSDMGYEPHYTYHLAWAARKLKSRAPVKHYDFSSSLAFCAIASAWIDIFHFDYRSPTITLAGLRAGQADLMGLPFPDGSLDSVSCMHVVEHVGLGRYGDPIDPQGDRNAAAELSRVLAPGGHLLFVVPVGEPRICFNAHRVYGLSQVLDLFTTLKLEDYAIVPDDYFGGMLERPAEEVILEQKWGCGCFHFVKPH